MDLFSDLENEIKKDNPSSPRLRRGEEKSDDIISVSEYLDRLNVTLKGEKAKIVGEVSGLQEYPGRSYLYFSIKDKEDQSTVKCFMWKNDYKTSGVTLADGVEIIITAYPNIYKPNGGMTLQVEMIEMVGEGALQIAYEKLKAKLSAEGLFDESRKRAIPEFPHTIGVITSKSGAVINDFLSNVGKCGFEILFVDSKVEGADAVKDLLSAVKTLAKKNIDVLVMMRGGGSLESFQAFNNEALIRAVAEFPAPVVTGIGHDKDAPLVSMVSDKNVSTPTAVANLLSAGFREAHLKVKISEQNIFSAFENVVREKLYILEEGERIMEKSFRSIFEKFDHYFQAIKHAEHRIESAIANTRVNLGTISKSLVSFAGNSIVTMNTRIENMAKILEARNPEHQLRLGWSIAKNAQGKVIRSTADIKKGEDFEVMVADGSIEAKRT
jgi:exodeoxyribonuclease VII large subunit